MCSVEKGYIEICAISKSFDPDREIVNIESLSIAKSEFFCILGPSGCGKSTLLDLISGSLSPDSGSIFVGGRPVAGPVLSCVQVYQDYGLYPWRTVRKNVEFGLEIQGISSSEIEVRVQQYIELVGLQDYQEFYPEELSGGMRQRVALARALAVEPDILLMDEPFAALDSITRMRLQKDVEEIWMSTNKTIVWVTHNIDEAISLGDSIAVMEPMPGRIREVFRNNRSRPRDQTGRSHVELKGSVMKCLGL